MQRMWRQMFAAVLGVLAVAGLSSAQSPAPNQLPQPLPPLRAQVIPAQVAPARVIPAQAATAPVVPVQGLHVRGSGGCGSCATPAANGPCTGPKSDCAFIFGSCKDFFDPCGPKHGGGWGGGHGRLGGGCGGHFGGRCPITPWGTPYGSCQNMCHYDSFLNH